MSELTRHPIRFEDEWLIAIDKPAGTVSHPNPRSGRCACAFAGAYDADERCFRTPGGLLWLIHRLDQDSSGLLLAAKSAAIAQSCRELFDSRQIRKTYLVLAAGKVVPAAGVWKDHLVKQTGGDRVRSVVRAALPPNAQLEYRVRSLVRSHSPATVLSLLEIILLTGRTHQIRVQTARRRHPVAGDRIYGDFALNRSLRQELGLRRLFLHAWQLEFVHPATHRPLKLTAPLPVELEACLAAQNPKP